MAKRWLSRFGLLERVGYPLIRPQTPAIDHWLIGQAHLRLLEFDS